MNFNIETLTFLVILFLAGCMLLVLVVVAITNCCNEIAAMWPAFRRYCGCTKLPGDLTDSYDALIEGENKNNKLEIDKHEKFGDL